MRDKLTMYPQPKYRDWDEVYPEFRYDYLFTRLGREELIQKYNLGAKKNFNKLVLRIKEELGFDRSVKRHIIHKKMDNGSLKVEEWL